MKPPNAYCTTCDCECMVHDELVAEKWCCPTCGDELYVKMVALKYRDESDEEELVEEGCEFGGLPDDI